VSEHGGPVAEPLPTQVTLVPLLAGVDASVLTQVPYLAEGLPTHLACVRFLSSVNPPVHVDLGPVGERLPTQVAGKQVPGRPQVPVERAGVADQGQAAGEHLVAGKTLRLMMIRFL
jgi:hypothetical protein